MRPLGIADGLTAFNTPQTTETLLEKTRPPRFVMWSLSATAIVAMHSCAPTEERVPDNPERGRSERAVRHMRRRGGAHLLRVRRHTLREGRSSE